MKAIERTHGILVMILTVLITNRGVWLCLTDLNDPLSFCSQNNPGEALILYFLASCLAIWLIVQSQTGKIFVSKWRGNFLVLVFMCVAVLSMLWSVHRISTLYHILILLFSTILAASLGTYFSPDRWLVLLAGTGAVIVIASLILWIFYPRAVIMGPPHEGAWRGIYWHKNLTGSLMALWNAVFLLYGLNIFRVSKWQAGASATFYLLSLVLILLSQSAAGIVIGSGLNFMIIIVLLWSRVRHTLKKQHYVLLGSAAAVLIILMITNLDFVFGLLNRQANLTGRIPLWNYLIENAVIQSPILGHGLSAIWDVPEFRSQITNDLGWSFTITNAHNGFMDILIGLGILGLVLVVLLLGQVFYRTAAQFARASTVENLFPLIIIVYLILSNLSTSFFLEVESFHWVLLVATMFMSTPTAEHQNLVDTSA